MTTSPIGRRALLRGAAALAALPALAACGSGTSRSSSGSGGSGGSGAGGGKTVAVRNSGGAYGDALKKAIYDPFTKETGITVQVANLDDAQVLAQIKQGRPQVDLIDNSMMSHAKFVGENALEALDLDRIKNLKTAQLPENLITEHAVAANFYAQCMAYRTDAFGGRTPESWADFWDAKGFQGGRSMCNPDADLPELEFALLADGVPMDKLYPLDVDRAFKAMDRIKGEIKKFWDSGPLPGMLLTRQEVTMATVWHGRLAALTQQGVPVAAQLNGARRQFQGYAISKGSANLDAAYQLFDYSISPEVQARLAMTYPTNPSSPLAYDKISEEVRNGLAGAPQFYDKGFDVDTEWWLKNEAAITKRWLGWARG